jgi:tryptophanyl-tRNA synthetase
VEYLDMQTKKRLLTGDTPTGKLHLGHLVGSLENRVKLQDEYDCYILIADTHALTTRAAQVDAIRQDVIDITLDYLAVGIDPKKSTIFIESAIPTIFELASLLSMLIPFPRLMRNPTIKDEIRDKNLGDNYSFGFLLYPILQVADILAFQANVVPVGQDQVPHIEMAREVARRFNQFYCGEGKKGLFPIPKPLIGRTERLVGIGAPSKTGQLLKMSKSLNNAIYLSDSPDVIRQKIMDMYTDPKRLRATDPGTVENNPLWIFHDTFNTDKTWVKDAKAKYRAGKIGDVECKKKLIDVLIELLTPIRQRREKYAQDLTFVQNVLKEGNTKGNQIANNLLKHVRQYMKFL